MNRWLWILGLATAIGCSGESGRNDDGTILPPANDDDSDSIDCDPHFEPIPGEDSCRCRLAGCPTDMEWDAVNCLCRNRPRSTAPAAVHGWLLLDAQSESVELALSKLDTYGVNHVELSHGLFDNVDDFLTPGRVDFVNGLLARPEMAGREVHLWAHEIHNPESFVEQGIPLCPDPSLPAPNLLTVRQDLYRQALIQMPGIAGFQLMFSSTDVTPWALRSACKCDFCKADPDPSRWIAILYGAVHEVVAGEFGKTLTLRTFIHQPTEQEDMRVALVDRIALPAESFPVMIKDVPNDWQPNYPHDRLIGNTGGRPTLIEFDLGMEYWGRSILPFSLVDYLKYRLDHARRTAGEDFLGAAARIERGGRPALGTPNEINFLALQRLLEDPDTTSEAILAEWMERRYGLAPGSEGSRQLVRLHRDSFEAVNKAIYTLGFWSLLKGSGLPDQARLPMMMIDRTTAKWDEDYTERSARMLDPDETILAEMVHEKGEAAALIDRALETLGIMEGDMADADLEALRGGWQALRLFNSASALVTEAAFRGLRVLNHPNDHGQGPRLAALAQQMRLLAQEVERGSAGGLNTLLSPAETLRALADDLNEDYPASLANRDTFRLPLQLGAVTLEATGPQTARLQWESAQPLRVTAVEYGFEVPDFGFWQPVGGGVATSGTIEIGGLIPDRTHFARLHLQNAVGEPMASSVYWVSTPAE